MKAELIDFLKWIEENSETDFIDKEELVDNYIKSINSDAQGESRSVSQNEQAKKFFCQENSRCAFNENGYCMQQNGICEWKRQIND